MEQLITQRQMVGLCRCGRMLYLTEDMRSFCNGCRKPGERCFCSDRE